MNCPKCGYEQNEGTECLRCGLVFSRYHSGPVFAAPPANPGPGTLRILFGYFLRFYRVFRWVTLAILIIALALILTTSKPPQIVIAPNAASLAEEKIAQFQSAVKQGTGYTLELNEPELNGWLNTNLALKNPGTSASIAPQTPESLISLAITATGGQPREEVSLQEVQSSVRDVKVALRDDRIHLYAIFDFHGKDLSLELEGRLSAQDGYLQLEPTSGKLGSLPLLAGTLRAVANRLFDSPENKDKFKLPSYIQDLGIENGALVVTSR
jgi:hypothetical protein